MAKICTPVPLLQIFFRKLKLKLWGKCVEESVPGDTKKGIESRLICSLYVQTMYKL